jgi:LacI family transcriptional regulator
MRSTQLSKRLQKTATHTPTLADVAKAAGVSTATVSRVVNRPESVRAALRERVAAHIESLGYVADGAARALASRRSRTVGAVIPTLANAIFAEGMDAFEARLGEAGHSLVLAQSGYDAAREAGQVRNLLERGVDAMLLIGSARAADVYDMLESRAVPFVETWTYHNADTRTRPCVGFDNRRAAYRATKHLIDLGHRELAMIAGIRAGNDRATERAEGFIATLDEHGIALAPDRLIEAPYDIAAGRRAMGTLLALPSPPSAVVCGNDVLALGALFECQRNGVAVPGEISITGFDDLPLARHLLPALTTMHVPSSEMGRAAADYLLKRLAGETPVAATDLDVELIVRGTTAPPPLSRL